VNENKNRGDITVEFSTRIKPSVAREYYSNVEKIYNELSINGVSPILNFDRKMWYITKENRAYDPQCQSLECLVDKTNFPEIRQLISPTHDLEMVIDNIERTMYATTSYKTGEMIAQSIPAQYNPEHGSYEYPISANVLPTWQDTAGIMVFCHLELVEELKYQRGSFNREIRGLIKQVLNAYAEKFSELYGSKDAIFGLDCFDEFYIIGAPTATLEIYHYYHNIVQDPIASGMIFEELVKRSNTWLKETEKEVNNIIEFPGELVYIKQMNGPNKLYNLPLSIHDKHNIVIKPFKLNNIEYNIIRLEDVDDNIIQETIQWIGNLNSESHLDCVDSLVANLWPTEYKQENKNWKKALDRWVRESRYKAKKEREDERKAQEDQVKNINDLKVNITPKYTDVFNTIKSISTEEIIRLYACDDWDTGIEMADYIEFNPSWRSSKRGSSCVVHTQENIFLDNGMNGGGNALCAMALGSRSIAYWDPSDNLTGDAYWQAIRALRVKGYDVPLFVPDVGSAKRNGDGEHEQTPLWAKLDAAVELGLCTEDEFVEVENEENGEKYHKLPDDVNAELCQILTDEYGYTVSKTNTEDEAESIDNSTDPSGAENAGGVRLGDVLGEDLTEDRDVDGEDELDKFLTYEEPDLDNPAIDVDVDAVAQFVDAFANIDRAAGGKVGMKKEVLINAFNKWAEINNVALDKLSKDTTMLYKKRYMKSALESTHDLSDGKVGEGDDRFRGFRSIILSDLGQELLEYDFD